VRPDSLLIVDDNEMNRDVLSRRLERIGYTVSLAENGHQTLEWIGQHDVDLVLLDVEMPGASGLEVLKILRQTYSPAQLPVIMVTAKVQSHDIVEALNLGANDYVTKPIDFAVALARIKTQLSHKRMVEALRESEERYALAARGANDGLWDWNLKSNEIYFSPRWKSMLGYEEEEIGSSPEEWFQRVHPEDLQRVREAMTAHLEGGTSHCETEHRMLHQNGTYHWMLTRGLAVRDANGKATRLAGSQTDITQGKVADALTGLPNRLLFVDRLERSVKNAKRSKDYLFAVFFLDLDRFKVINDSLGHVVGDQLLVATARRLESCLRSTDAVSRLGESHTVARLGGDEFTILLDDIKHISDATRVAERVQKELALPFNLNGQEVFTTVSIGIAVSATGYDRPQDLLRDADTAMYRAKALGKARYELFDTAMRDVAMASLQLETDLRRAIERQEFRNFYQPIVSLETGRIAGFEALVRWQHPERGLVSPAGFILVAEESGMIVSIGHWVLREACRQMKAWQAKFPITTSWMISVNLSTKQFKQPDLVEQIEHVLRDTGLEGSSLKLEITESLIMDNVDSATAMLSQLKALGIQLSMDDFGTGYSSLSYLHQFPMHTLKVDRSFVSRMGQHGQSTDIARTIVMLAHQLGLDVVAEGVETAEQLAQLQSLGCEYAQGYFFSAPVDSVKAEGLIEVERRWDSSWASEDISSDRLRL
jgi:diguanylate cyclase (GGDEF)-like protein/PAS domain S-box-containing protein